MGGPQQKVSVQCTAASTMPAAQLRQMGGSRINNDIINLFVPGSAAGFLACSRLPHRCLLLSLRLALLTVVCGGPGACRGSALASLDGRRAAVQGPEVADGSAAAPPQALGMQLCPAKWKATWAGAHERCSVAWQVAHCLSGQAMVQSAMPERAGCHACQTAAAAAAAE